MTDKFTDKVVKGILGGAMAVGGFFYLKSLMKSHDFPQSSLNQLSAKDFKEKNRVSLVQLGTLDFSAHKNLLGQLTFETFKDSVDIYKIMFIQDSHENIFIIKKYQQTPKFKYSLYVSFRSEKTAEQELSLIKFLNAYQLDACFHKTA